VASEDRVGRGFEGWPGPTNQQSCQPQGEVHRGLPACRNIARYGSGLNASSGPATTLAFLARPCALHTPAHPSTVPGCYAVVVPVAELEANSIDITYRDYCAHLLIPLNKWVVIFRSRQARQSTDLPSSFWLPPALLLHRASVASAHIEPVCRPKLPFSVT